MPEWLQIKLIDANVSLTWDRLGFWIVGAILVEENGVPGREADLLNSYFGGADGRSLVKSLEHSVSSGRFRLLTKLRLLSTPGGMVIERVS